MAYNTQEERLKVKGSESITRDLQVTGDVYVGGDLTVNNSTALTEADRGVSNGVASLDATGRVPYSQLPESAMEYKGTWDASTNTPSLADGTGTNGDFYVVSVAGTVNLGTVANPRNVTFYVNDRIIYDGTLHEWERLPAGEVRSVNGQSGDVTLSIPAAQVNSDWNAISGVAQILNKPTIPTVVDTVADGNMNAVTSNAVETAISGEATNRNSAISDAINALDVSDSAVSGQYVSAVSETNGKISVTRENLPNTINNAKSLNSAIEVYPNSETISVDLPGFVLKRGARFILDVKNSYSATAQFVDIKLNVNNTGSYTIVCDGVILQGNGRRTLPEGVYSCFFDGYEWFLESKFEAASARSAGGLGNDARLSLSGTSINTNNLKPLSNLHPYLLTTTASGQAMPNYFSCIGSFGTSAVIYASTAGGSNEIVGFGLTGYSMGGSTGYYELPLLASMQLPLRLLIL